MLATIINVILILLGSAAGLLFKNLISERLMSILTHALGLCVLGIGISSMIGTQDTLCVIVCMAAGTVLGHAIDIERRLEGAGDLLRTRLLKGGGGNSRFTEGFVSAAVLFCVGAMTIMGAIQDGLGQGYSLLLTKSSLDFIASIVLGASLGIGVPCAALTVLVYQGALTLLAGSLKDVLAGALMDQICMVGYAIVICIGINFFGVVKIKTASLLPALLGPVLWNVTMWLKTLWV